MSSWSQRILDTLHQHMEPNVARVVFKSCMDTLKVSPAQLSDAMLPRAIASLTSTANMFIPVEKRAGLARALKDLATGLAELESKLVNVITEHDLSAARTSARTMCELLGANGLQTQKAVTAVSETARNILSYAGTGVIELIPLRGPPPRLRVRAVDKGPGIPNLEEILAGKYRSKTGMGLGLLGVKRVSQSFDVQTGPGGTTVSFEINT